MQNDFLPLPIRFEKNGFIYWQVCRTPAAAIYEQRTPDGRSIFYEVWRIRRQKERQLDGRTLVAREAMPGNEDWGKYGWTYYRLPDAKKRYDEINGAIYQPAADPAGNRLRAANQGQPGAPVPSVNLGVIK